jgi:sugar phosphate isomerase/epimerase
MPTPQGVPASGPDREGPALSWAVSFPERPASWRDPWPLAEAAAACAREGIRATEINYAVVEALEPVQQQAAFDLLAAVGTRVISMHAPFSEPCALEPPDRAKRLAAVDRTIRCLRICQAHGVSRLVIHPSNRPGTDRQPVIDNLCRSLEDLVPVAETTGVTLCLENMPPYHPFGWQATDVPSIVQRFNHRRLRAVFDSGHALMTGAPVEIFEGMRTSIAHVHLHDNNGDRDLHLPPGYGTMPWPDLMPRLLDLQLDVPLFVEAPPWGGYTGFKRLQLEMTALAHACLGAVRFPSLRKPGITESWCLQRDSSTGRLVVFDAQGQRL